MTACPSRSPHPPSRGFPAPDSLPFLSATYFFRARGLTASNPEPFPTTELRSSSCPLASHARDKLVKSTIGYTSRLTLDWRL